MGSQGRRHSFHGLLSQNKKGQKECAASWHTDYKPERISLEPKAAGTVSVKEAVWV